VALHAALGFRVGLCDLTRGELGSNGTPEEREAEAEDARAVLGAAWRVNLHWADGAISGSDNQMLDVVRLIRRTRPRTVALPYWNDRHPDHRAASDVLARAVFKSGLRRFAPEAGESWRPDWICYYFINDSAPESFGVDVTMHYETKRRALACHRSQFTTATSGSVATRLTAPQFQQLIESRDAHLGALLGVGFAEAVVVREPILRPHVMKHWNDRQADRP
jgi:bacillithiol biosynthesis deacetylase BshB1